MKFKGLLKVALLLVAVSALFVACDTLAGGRFPHVETVYMKPGEDWASDTPVYAAWMWTDGKEGSWTELTKSTIEEDLWEVAVPSEIDNIIFVKMKDGTTKDKFSWDNKEEQTADLKVPYVFDNVQVYSIKAKEWIAIGAEEKEPEPVAPPEDAGIELSKITHIVGIDGDWKNHIELTNNTFTFYASKTKEEFVFTSGKFEDNVSYKAFGATVEEFGKEYAIITGLCGGENQTNIVIKNLKVDNEYKITLSAGLDGKLFVKVVATGNKIETPSVVYKHTVAISEISTAWTGSSEKANFTIMLMTDDEFSRVNELDDGEKGALRVDGGKNIEIYTHAPGNYNTHVEGVAATVTDSELTVFIEVSGAKVEAGKKPYVLALDTNGTKEVWGAKLVAMTPGATMPTDLKENVAPLPPADCGIVYTPEEDTIYVYCKDGFLSGSDNEKIVAYFMGDGTAFETMSPVDGLDDKYANKVFKVAIPEGKNYTGVIITRQDKTKENSWDVTWNQTGDLTLPTDDKVCFVVDSWDKSNLTDDDWFAFKAQ